MLYISLPLSVWPEEVKLTLDDPAEDNGWGESTGKRSPAWDRRNFSLLTCNMCCQVLTGYKWTRHLCFHAHGRNRVHQWISHINTTEGCRHARYSVTAGCLGFSSIAEKEQEQLANFKHSSHNDTQCLLSGYSTNKLQKANCKLFFSVIGEMDADWFLSIMIFIKVGEWTFFFHL